MDTIRDDTFFSQRHAVRPLKIIVVGAGIGGLSVGLGMRKTGHEVLILEKVCEITEVGAGIQVAPNAARILHRFGVLEEIMKHATVLERNSVRRYDSDEELGSIPLMPGVGKEYGAPLAVIHRGDLHGVLLSAAIRSGCQILTDHRVVETDMDFQAHVLVSSDGRREWFAGDVVIAADGMNSLVRKRIAAACGHKDQLVPTGEAAYRLLLPRELMQQDEGLSSILGENRGTRYMGPHGHLMGYPLRNNTLYNMVLLHPAKAYGAVQENQQPSWTIHGRKKDMLEFYKGWSPLVRAMLEAAPESEILESTMSNLSPLPTWVKGRIALAGDSCHVMLPFVAQGAANAIEDAGVLAAAFTCTDDVETALGVYQAVRKERGEKIQASATDTGKSLHLPDGPEQVKRDEAIRSASRGGGPNPDRWCDKTWNEFMWGVDVMQDTIKKWDSLAAEVTKQRLHVEDSVIYR